MLTIKEIKDNQEIMDCLDLEMTPEKAVALYLEWGAFSVHGQAFVRSGDETSCFFTVDAWKEPARVFLVRQSMSGREEIGEVEVPQQLVDEIVQYWGGKRGTYAISREMQHWIRKQL